MTKFNRSLLASLALVAAAGLGACCQHCDDHDDHKVEAKALNTTCPFSGQPASASVTSEMHGQKVAFCCAGCKAKFDKMDHAAQHAVMDKAK